MIRGGYQLIDLKEKTLPATIPGTHAALAALAAHGKTLKLSGLVVSGNTRPECDGYVTLSGTTFTIHADNHTITVTSADLCTMTA